jgi:lipopolysaccharide transport system ATP-binding protein
MEKLQDSIIEFSELGDAIDRPVKTYSSGMTVRLAFALVTAVEPDVLIVDEALAVGDQHFQKKCVERIESFRNNGCTILFCSHSLYHVRHLCDVALWLHGGKQRSWGPTERVLSAYETHVREQNRKDETPAHSAAPVTPAPTPQAVLEPQRRGAIVSVDVPNLGAGQPPVLESPDLQVTVVARLAEGERPSIGVMLQQTHGVGITVAATHEDGACALHGPDGLWRATVTFPALPLHSGEYVLSAYLADSQGLVIYDEWLQCTAFAWESPSLMPGLVRLPHHWT